MLKSSILIPLCASFFALAILAGYFAPRLYPDMKVDRVALALAPPVVEPRKRIPQLVPPFPGKALPSDFVPKNDSPLVGEGRVFIDSMAAYVYYDPPYETNPFHFAGADETYIKRDDLKGHYTLLNLWATWCAYCIDEMPALQRVKEKFAGTDLKVMAVSVDIGMNMDKIGQFLDLHRLGDVGMHYDYNGDMQVAFPVSALPVTFLLNPEGKVVYSMGGTAKWDSPGGLAFLESFVPLKQ